MFCLSVRYGNHSSDMVGQVYRILLLQLHNSACQEAGKETFGDAFFCTSVTRSYEEKIGGFLAISYTVQCSKSLKVSVFHSYFGSTENKLRSEMNRTKVSHKILLMKSSGNHFIFYPYFT